jgi:hypothetical protein
MALKKIEPLGRVPRAFKAIADKVNELVAAQNRAQLIAGDGISITETDAGTRIDLSISVSGVCNGDSTITITVNAK